MSRMTECSRRATTTTRFTKHGFKRKINVKKTLQLTLKRKINIDENQQHYR